MAIMIVKGGKANCEEAMQGICEFLGGGEDCGHAVADAFCSSDPSMDAIGMVAGPVGLPVSGAKVAISASTRFVGKAESAALSFGRNLAWQLVLRKQFTAPLAESVAREAAPQGFLMSIRRNSPFIAGAAALATGLAQALGTPFINDEGAQKIHAQPDGAPAEIPVGDGMPARDDIVRQDLPGYGPVISALLPGEDKGEYTLPGDGKIENVREPDSNAEAVDDPRPAGSASEVFAPGLVNQNVRFDASATIISPSADIPVERYGSKAEGLKRLVDLQQKSPVPYLVPLSIAVPAQSAGGYTHDEIDDAFRTLTKALKKDAVLMARSSGINERPGENPTLFVRFDPKDIKASRQRFLEAVDSVSGVSPDMGVVLTKLVGRPTFSSSHTPAIGRENASFVANSHSPLNPGEVYIAIVHGLGTRVVDGKSGFISLTAERSSGLITSFLNQDPKYAMEQTASVSGVVSPEQYRQQNRDVYGIESGQIIVEKFDEDTSGPMAHMSVYDGQLVDALGFSLSEYFGGTPVHSFTKFLAWTPFPSIADAQSLIGALQFLSTELGPVQIEGSFAPDTKGKMSFYLYQLLRLPSEAGEVAPLSIQDPTFTSGRVIGRGKWVLPFVDFNKVRFPDRNGDLHPEERQLLRLMDDSFASTGYALLDDHEAPVVAATPNARIRIYNGMGNLASHGVTDMLFRLDDDKSYGMIAMEVKVAQGRQMPEPDSREGSIRVWSNVQFESNGKEMAAAFPEPELPSESKQERQPGLLQRFLKWFK